MSNMNDTPKQPRCPDCGDYNTSRHWSTVSINRGTCSRVYYQWRGDPNKCPPELRDALKNQDMPKGVTEFRNEGKPILGTGERFKKVS
jgi:hypothetical protein